MKKIVTTTTCTGCGSAIPESVLDRSQPDSAHCVNCRYHIEESETYTATGSGTATEYEIATATVAAPTPSTGDRTSDFAVKLRLFLEWQVISGSIDTAGKKAFVVAHLGGFSGCKTDADMARKLEITPARFSQLRTEIRHIFGEFGACNRRQNLTSSA